MRAEFFIIYRPTRKFITKIEVDIPTVDFVYLKNVGLSGCLLEFGRSVSSRPSTRRSTKGRSTDHTARCTAFIYVAMLTLFRI